MGMSTQPTDDGGRRVSGNTSWCEYEYIHDASGKLVSWRFTARTPKDEQLTWDEAAQRLIRGVLGLTQVVLGIHRPPEYVIATRESICDTCDENVHGFCGQLLKPGKDKCGCLIKAKVRLANEQC